MRELHDARRGRLRALRVGVSLVPRRPRVHARARGADRGAAPAPRPQRGAAAASGPRRAGADERGRARAPADARFMRAGRSRSRARGLGRTYPEPAGRRGPGARRARRGRGLHAPRGRAARRDRGAPRGAASRARGAELYVTLEPCTHHGRTPPCVDALLAARALARVVVGAVDPEPARARAGHPAAARGAASRSSVGVEATRRPAIWSRAIRSRVLRGRPLVTLKLAVDARRPHRRARRRRALDHRRRGAPARARELRDVSRRHPGRRGHGARRRSAAHLPHRAAGTNPVRVVVAGRAPRSATAARASSTSRRPADARGRRRPARRRARVAALRRARRRGRRCCPARRGACRSRRVVQALAARGITIVLVEGGGDAWRRTRCAPASSTASSCSSRRRCSAATACRPSGALGIARAADARAPRPDVDVRRVGDGHRRRRVGPRTAPHPLPPPWPRGSVAPMAATDARVGPRRTGSAPADWSCWSTTRPIRREASLVCAAARVTPAAVNFMATHGRGLVCLAPDARAHAPARHPADDRRS